MKRMTYQELEVYARTLELKILMDTRFVIEGKKNEIQKQKKKQKRNT